MQAITPDAHGIAVLILTAVALFLFTRDNIPLESSSLAILIILVAGFQLVPYEKAGEVVLAPIDFFAGFGNEALVAICALMMVGKALETTGALQPLATVVSQVPGIRGHAADGARDDCWRHVYNDRYVNQLAGCWYRT